MARTVHCLIDVLITSYIFVKNYLTYLEKTLKSIDSINIRQKIKKILHCCSTFELIETHYEKICKSSHLVVTFTTLRNSGLNMRSFFIKAILLRVNITNFNTIQPV